MRAVIAALLMLTLARLQGTSPSLFVWNTASKVSADRWNWSAFLLADDSTLARVNCVTYVLHPTFTPQTRQVCGRGTNDMPFALSTNGWGAFELGVIVTFRDNTAPVQLRYPLRLTGTIYVTKALAVAPTLTVFAQASNPRDGKFEFRFRTRTQGGNLQLFLEEIRVFEDGSAGATRWYFDVLVNGIKAFSLGERRYDDTNRPGVVSLSLPAVSLARGGANVSITILGKKP
jgi:hypothetical protein